MNHETPKLAVDCVVFVQDGPGNGIAHRTGIVLIKRKYPPLGCALPGGFVDVGETTRAAAVREMKEELNMDVRIVRLQGVYDEPDRDPRKHVVSIAYVALPDDELARPIAGDDAKEAFVWWVDEPMPEMVCDHAQIIKDACRGRVELNLG